MTRGWQGLGLGAAVAAIGLFLVPQRHPGAEIPWYRTSGSDADRYIAMTGGQAQPYPWGGRWGVPALARLLPLEAADALVVVNVVSLVLAAAAISWLALLVAGRLAAVATAWVFAATGAGLLFLFQNPYLTDATALLLFAVIGILFVREQWTLVALAIAAGVTVKEVCVGFIVLLLVARQWALATLTAAVSFGLLFVGWRMSEGSEAKAVDLGVGTVVKLYFGLGAAWLLVAVVVAVAVSRRWTDLAGYGRGFAAFAVVTFGLALVSLPLATDTTRLMLFALPAVIPAVAWLIRDVSPRLLVLAAVAAVPAALVVIPTRVTLDALAPEPFRELEQWYSANMVVVAATGLLAAVAAVFVVVRGSVLTRRQLVRRPS